MSVCFGGFRGSGRSRGAEPLTARVVRGGSWNNNPQNCRSSNRNRNEPDNRNNNIGFRVVVHFCGKRCRPGIIGFTDPMSVAAKVLAPLLSRPAVLPGGRIYGVGPGGSGIPCGERPVRLFILITMLMSV